VLIYKNTLMPVAPAPVVPRRGRPRKFAVPSRAVTLTLPEDVLAALGEVDPDIGRAIVRIMQPARARQKHPPAELETFGRRAVIVVNPTPSLERQPGVHLVPLPDGRALISFDQSATIADLELFITDELDSRRLSTGDREIYESVRNILRGARQSAGVTLIQRQIVVLESGRKASPTSARRTTRRTR
jgi:hypothetical protein